MKKIIDVTGTPLRPSWQGWRCPGNGEHPKYQCCCDECDFFLGCFPQYDHRLGRLKKAVIRLLVREEEL